MVLSMVMLGSSMIVSASELSSESEAASENAQEELDSVQENAEDDGDQASGLQTEDELLGTVVEIAGADQRENAVNINLDTDYASTKQGAWYQFTTKEQPAWYQLETSHVNHWGNYWIYLYDGIKEINSIGSWGNGKTVTKHLKLEENHTYHLYSGTDEAVTSYFFDIKAFDDPEGDKEEDKEAYYALPLGEEHLTSIAVDEDVDFYKIHTGKAGHYRIAVTNATGGWKHFELKDRWGGGKDLTVEMLSKRAQLQIFV